MQPIDDKKKWLAEYRETAAALEAIEIRRLMAMTDEEAMRILMTLKVAEPPWRERPDWSGLVEQQALFHRKKKS